MSANAFGISMLMPDRSTNGGDQNYWKLRKEVVEKAEDNVKGETPAYGRLDGLPADIAVVEAVTLFHKRWDDDISQSDATNDALFAIGHSKEFYDLIRNRNDDAELGRIFADACNAALVNSCVDDGYSETMDERD
jgi:hypothetical protein